MIRLYSLICSPQLNLRPGKDGTKWPAELSNPLPRPRRPLRGRVGAFGALGRPFMGLTAPSVRLMGKKNINGFCH